jgi:hypothetical protein
MPESRRLGIGSLGGIESQRLEAGARLPISRAGVAPNVIQSYALPERLAFVVTGTPRMGQGRDLIKSAHLHA